MQAVRLSNVSVAMHLILLTDDVDELQRCLKDAVTHLVSHSSCRCSGTSVWHQLVPHLLLAVSGVRRAAPTACISLWHPTRRLQQPTHFCACLQGSSEGDAIATMLLAREDVRAAFVADWVPPKHRQEAQVGSPLLCTGLQA